MPSLTQRQWDAVRRVAAEAARRIVDEGYAGVGLGDIDFHPSQIAEIQSIATATARKHLRQKESILEEKIRQLEDNVAGAAVATNRRLERLEYQAANPSTRVVYTDLPTANLADRLANLERSLDLEKNAARSADAQFRSKLEKLEEYASKGTLSNFVMLCDRIDSHEKALTKHTEDIKGLRANADYLTRTEKSTREVINNLKKRADNTDYTLRKQRASVNSLHGPVVDLMKKDKARDEAKKSLHASLYDQAAVSSEIRQKVSDVFPQFFYTSNPTGPNRMRDRWLYGDWGSKYADDHIFDSDRYRKAFTHGFDEFSAFPPVVGRTAPFKISPAGGWLNPKNGDQKIENGETFYFWWGQWRRESEIAGFSNWVTKKALGKK